MEIAAPLPAIFGEGWRPAADVGRHFDGAHHWNQVWSNAAEFRRFRKGLHDILGRAKMCGGKPRHDEFGTGARPEPGRAHQPQMSDIDKTLPNGACTTCRRH